MAMFGGGGFNTSNNNGFNVRSQGPRFVGENSQIALQFWDNKLTVTYYPLQGIDDRGFKTFNRDARVSTTMKGSDALLLFNEAKRTILPEIEKTVNGEEASEVSCGTMKGTTSKNLWMLEYKKDEEGKFATYLNIYFNIGQDNKPAQVFSHKFAKREVATGYDPGTGDGSSVEREMDFELFMRVLKGVAEIEGPIPHGVAYANAVRSSRSQNSGYNNNGGFNNNNGGFSGNQNSGASNNNEYTAEGNDLPF